MGKLITTMSPDRLLNMLSIILCGQPYRHPGAPPRTIQAPLANAVTIPV